MRFVVLLALALGVIAGVIVIIVLTERRRRERLARMPGRVRALPEAEQESYVHAQRLARLLERVLSDDMIRVTVPEPLQLEMRRRLDDFYGESTTLNRR